MHSVSEIISELSGSGLTQTDLFDISKNLTEISISRANLYKRLLGVIDEEEIESILSTATAASFQEEFTAKVFDVLTPTQKERYLLHTVECRSLGSIAKEQGVSTVSVYLSVTQAREKIELLKAGRKYSREGKYVRFLPEPK